MKALLFDLDGTLTDTETLAIDIVYNQLLKRGYTIAHRDLHTFTGKPPKDFFPAVIRAFDLPISSDELLEEFFALYIPEIAKGIHFFPEIKSVLEKLQKKGHRMAIVSGSNREIIEKVLAYNDAAKYFSFIIGIEDSIVGKPDPTGYRLGAERFGLPPEECVVIEDAVPGIDAGLSAKMQVIAVDRMNKIPDSEKYVKIATFVDLEKHL